MQGLGSARDSLLRHTSRPRPLVLDVLKGKGSLIEVVRCFENGLILFEQIEHTPDHKANVAEGSLFALRCGLQLQHRRTHSPKQHLQGRRKGKWDGRIGHGGHRWSEHVGAQLGQDTSVLPYPPVLMPSGCTLKRRLHHPVWAEILSIVESE
jgi:hypothetical protein